MKETLREMIRAAAVAAFEKGVLSSSRFPDIEIDEPRSREHGDFATNMAMVSASIQKTAPRKIAEAIVTHLADPSNILLKTEIAGPGFINFFIRPEAWLPVLRRVLERLSPDERSLVVTMGVLGGAAGRYRWNVQAILSDDGSIAEYQAIVRKLSD